MNGIVFVFVVDVAAIVLSGRIMPIVKFKMALGVIIRQVANDVCVSVVEFFVNLAL